MNVAPHHRDTRPTAAAGRFYPAQAEPLRREVAHHLAPQQSSPGSRPPQAIIAPHAGYPYSGPIAGSAFAAYPAKPTTSHRVVLIGPAHYVGFSGLAVSSAQAFALPTGHVAVDHESVQALLRQGLAKVHDEAHQPEHALEVELPFLQAILPEFTIVPILVGDASANQVAEALEALWTTPETTVVVSSDLSHYLDYTSAQAVDAETRNAVEALDPEPIDSYHACGCLAIQGLLQVAKRRQLQVSTLDLRNSGDTAGPRDQVVGYGAWTFQGTADGS